MNKWIAFFGLFAVALSVSAFRFAAASPEEAEGEPLVADACAENRELVKELLSHSPPHIKKFACKKLGRPPAGVDLGPNCFTAARLWLDPDQPIQFVNGKEFGETLSSYEPISREQLRTGDLVVFEREDLRDGDLRYYTHGAVYVKGDLVWNKLGPTKIFDHGNGAKWVEPAWTFTSITSLQDTFDTSTVGFYRHK